MYVVAKKNFLFFVFLFFFFLGFKIPSPFSSGDRLVLGDGTEGKREEGDTTAVPRHHESGAELKVD